MNLKVDRSLAGKVAIVTGAGCKGEGIGNGRAAAILLAQDGCSVVCVDREEAWAVKTADIIKADGRGASAVCVGDVTKAADAAKIVATAIETFGRLDILINNVGIAGPNGTAETVNMDEWTRGLDVNISSMVLMAKHAIPEMKKNYGEIKGSIVNLGSVAGLGGGLPILLYPVSKGAIVNLTQSMASHHGRDGIRVNCVCPGSVYTPLVFENSTMTDQVREARKQGNCLGIEGTGWDTAYGVRWLAGPEARWVTGVILPVDAGVSALVPLSVPKYDG